MSPYSDIATALPIVVRGGPSTLDDVWSPPTGSPVSCCAVPIVVRYGHYQDIDAMAELNTAVWQETSMSVADDDEELVTETAFTAQQLKRRLTRRMMHSSAHRGGGRVVVAEYQHQLIGVARSGPAQYPDSPRALELHNISVLRQFHGCGVADAMLKLTLGHQPACLWVGTTNERAQSFYRKHGFTQWLADSSTSDLLCMVR